jgi:hypothetical protein
VAENAAIGTFLVKVVDPNNAAVKTYDWWFEDNANGAFAINATTGAITVAKALDYETQKSYAMQVRVTDADKLWTLTDVAINVTNVNEPPSDIVLSNTAIPEAQANPVVGTLTATDPEGGAITFALTAGGANFRLDLTNPLKPTLVGTTTFDVDAPGAAKSYSVTVKATDSTGLSFSKTFTITITPVMAAAFHGAPSLWPNRRSRPTHRPAVAAALHRTRLGAVVAAVARTLVPNCSAAAVANTAQ